MKKILAFCLLAISLGFAQDPDSQPPAEVPIVPVKPIGAASAFDAVRGHSYNPFGITGAPSSVTDLIGTPSDIYGKKFFYVSPTENRAGYIAFNSFGGSTLLGLQSGDNLVLGYATPAFGAALEYSIQKQWKDTTQNSAPSATTAYSRTTSTRTTYPGDNIGLRFSLPLGSSTAYAGAGWRTNDTSYVVEVSGDTLSDNNGWIKYDESTISLWGGLLGSLGTLNYDAQLAILRNGGTITSSYKGFSSMGDKVVTRGSYSGIDLSAKLSYTALKNETARVLVGSNNSIGARFFDKVDSEPGYAGATVTTIAINPNILGEMFFTNSFLVFAGATHSIDFRFGSLDPMLIRNEDYNETNVSQSSTNAVLGIRYQKTDWAFETQITQNNPFAAFAGTNIFWEFGGFIYF